MEGAGSRQSRASSRYASPAAFAGPVRKWRKQWVASLSDNQSRAGKRNDAPPLLLCRWTPLSAADDPPRRRRRFTPIVAIEKGSMENEGRGSIRNQSNININGGMVEPNISKEEAQEVNEDEVDTDDY